jgi:TPR repeat protein
VSCNSNLRPESGVVDNLQLARHLRQRLAATTPELPRAAARYRSCAERGHDWGEYNIGNMLFDGRGVPRDLPLALCWYLRAASQGHGRAVNVVEPTGSAWLHSPTMRICGVRS